jgi:hypothetical protein
MRTQRGTAMALRQRVVAIGHSFSHVCMSGGNVCTFGRLTAFAIVEAERAADRRLGATADVSGSLGKAPGRSASAAEGLSRASTGVATIFTAGDVATAARTRDPEAIFGAGYGVTALAAGFVAPPFGVGLGLAKLVESLIPETPDAFAQEMASMGTEMYSAVTTPGIYLRIFESYVRWAESRVSSPLWARVTAVSALTAAAFMNAIALMLIVQAVGGPRIGD